MSSGRIDDGRLRVSIENRILGAREGQVPDQPDERDGGHHCVGTHERDAIRQSAE